MEAVAAELKGFLGALHWRDTDGCGFAEALGRAAGTSPVLAQRKPLLLARPQSEADVQLAVAAAREGLRRNLWGPVPVTVRGGGHSELCLHDGALALDLGCLASVACDAEAGLVTLGGGACVGEVQAAAAAHGLAVPLGLHRTVGCGLVLQGGVGRLTRLHGLTVDNIVSLDLVTADGRVRRLHQGCEDEELFWAARGAAPNFGVATSVTLRAYPAGPCLCGRFLRGVGCKTESAQLLATWEHTLRALDHDQQADFAFGWSKGEPTMGLFPCSVLGRPFDDQTCSALGFSNDDLGSCSVSDVPYPDLANEGAEEAGGTNQAAQGMLTYVRHCFVDRLGTEGFQKLLDAVDSMPSVLSELLLQHGGGAARVPAIDALPFACRVWEFSVVIVAMWREEGARAANEAWADAVVTSLEPLSTGTYAVNTDPYRRPATAASEVAQAFGPNLARLRALKTSVDPDNLFRGTYSFFP